MTRVEVFVDPSCPWAWITSRWVKEVAPQRDLVVSWRSYCLEIRDDYGVAPTVPEQLRQVAIADHAVSHRMLRIFEAARAEDGEDAVDSLYTEWGSRFFVEGQRRDDSLLIVEAMEVAYAFGGPKTQTPTIVISANPPYGFKGPVMAPAPTDEAAVRLWDAIQVVCQEPGFFEITRPRANPPQVPTHGKGVSAVAVMDSGARLR
jgi:hypothetical protein